jgi:hypothetical protein
MLPSLAPLARTRSNKPKVNIGPSQKKRANNVLEWFQQVQLIVSVGGCGLKLATGWSGLELFARFHNFKLFEAEHNRMGGFPLIFQIQMNENINLVSYA